MQVSVKVDASKVVVAMAGFRLGLAQRTELLKVLGAGQLASIYRTFDEGGSPAGSWPPLSPNSLRWSKYSGGHKLLMNTGQMRNSIGVTTSGNSVSIGTNLKRAAVHQLGYSGPQSVRAYSYTRRVKSRDSFGSSRATNKLGRQQTVRRKLSSGVTTVNVKAFTRIIHIPARPFLVFRPEDPERMRAATKAFLMQRARAAGLEAI